jgi:glutamine synthetase type III
MVVESTLKEAIARQLAAERTLDGKIADHTQEMQEMLSNMNSHVEGKEAMILQQLESSLQRLRAYAFDLEQNMESVRSAAVTLEKNRFMCIE